MVLLGIDQGLANMGYSVIEVLMTKKTTRKGFVKLKKGMYVKIIESGCLVTTPKQTLPRRLFRLSAVIESKILEYEPEGVCCEHLFFSIPGTNGRNKSSAIMTTNMVTGNIASICGKYRIPFYMYPPTNVKKLLCDTGKATKEEVMAAIDKIFLLEAPANKKDHIYDSVAIGISCALHILTGMDEKEEPEVQEGCEEVV